MCSPLHSRELEVVRRLVPGTAGKEIDSDISESADGNTLQRFSATRRISRKGKGETSVRGWGFATYAGSHHELRDARMPRSLAS